MPFSNSKRIPELDGLRGIAILLVLIWHYIVIQTNLPPDSMTSKVMAAGLLAWSGVDLFFVLSGLLLGGILLDAKDSPNYFKTFYARRFYRIAPLYFALLLIYVILKSSITHSWLFGAPLPVYSYATFTQNFWQSGRETMGSSFLGITWSLAVEEQFYLVLPLIIRYAKRLPLTLLSLIILAPILRTILYFNGWGIGIYVLMFCRMDSLMLGVLGAWMIKNKKEFPLWLFPILLLGVAVFTVKGWTIGTMMMSTIGYSWLALFYLSLIFLALKTKSRLISNPALTRLGIIAYGIYLFHQAVNGLIHGGKPTVTDLKSLSITLISLAVTLALAQISWNYLEKPLVRIGHRFRY